MKTIERADAEYIELLPVWMQTRAAIQGKIGIVTLLGGEHGYFSIVAPAYRINQNDSSITTKRRVDYFSRGRFTNFTGVTHDTYLGMITERPVEVELPSAIDGIKENADGSKTTLTDFATEVTSEVLTTARAGILVDPPNLSGATQAQAKDSLPKWISYKAEQILNHVVKDGVLVRVELLEMVYELSNGDYELIEQVRRLDLVDSVYTVTVLRDDKPDGVAVTPTINSKTMDFIPFQFIGAENNKPNYDRPVMFDLAHQNIGHFMLDCDNRDNLHYHGQGMTNIFTDTDTDAMAELNPDGIDVGAKGKNVFGKDDRVEILQIEATGAIASEMLRDEQRMIMLGAQVVQDKSSSKTLGGEVMEKNAATSQLKRIALNVSNGLTQCAKWSAQIMGAVDADVLIKVNDRFVTENMTFQDVTAMFSLYQQGAASLNELNEVKRKANYTEKSNVELEEDLENDTSGGETEQVATLQMEIDRLNELLAGGANE